MDNGLNQASAWSNVRSFHTKLSKPVAISPIGSVKVTNLKPTIKWNPVSGATGYTIQVSRNTAFTSLVVNATGPMVGAKYAPTSNQPAHATLYWRVRANGTNGPRDWMAMAVFKTP